MGRGKYPRKNVAPTMVQTVLSDSPKKEVELGSSPSRSAKRQCWTFTLQDATPISANIPAGTAARGITSNSAVMVICNAGTLGYAPASVSTAMLTALDASAGSLAGEILEDRRIRLCLVD